jgi:hypothetical protein
MRGHALLIEARTFKPVVLIVHFSDVSTVLITYPDNDPWGY